MLGVPPGADQQTIKQAFRREIARYHPDKVTHLGVEFQQMAAERAAELTAAYNTLGDEALRAAYDAHLVPGGAAEPPSSAAPPPPQATEPDQVAAGPRPDRFHRERAHRDHILRRAMLTRLRDEFTSGDYDAPILSGFDLSLVPRRGPVFRRQTRPTVLVRVAERVDGPTTMQAWTDALRARLTEKPIVLLLLAREIDRASVREVVADRHRKHPGLAETIIPVAMNLGDGSAELSPQTPVAVASVVDRVRNFVS